MDNKPSGQGMKMTLEPCTKVQVDPYEKSMKVNSKMVFQTAKVN